MRGEAWDGDEEHDRVSSQSGGVEPGLEASDVKVQKAKGSVMGSRGQRRVGSGAAQNLRLQALGSLQDCPREFDSLPKALGTPRALNRSMAGLDYNSGVSLATWSLNVRVQSI